MKKLAYAASALLLAIVGAACSHASASQGPEASALPSSVKVTEGEMYLHTSATKVAAGTVTFTVANDGAIHHEFVVVTGDPTGTKGDEPGRVSESGHIGGEEGPEIGDIAPGGTETLVANLSPGTYTAMCNLPGHYAGGMHFQFTVQ
jgi:uncharacterized cupredoxin-like copper-binding protein